MISEHLSRVQAMVEDGQQTWDLNPNDVAALRWLLKQRGMVAKCLEVRDRGTYIPVVCVRLDPQVEPERYMFGRAGYGLTPDAQRQYVLVGKIDGSAVPPVFTYDEHAWGDTRTMTVAHRYIREHWEELESGAVVDVEFILGEKDRPKVSEQITDHGLGIVDEYAHLRGGQ